MTFRTRIPGAVAAASAGCVRRWPASLAVLCGLCGLLGLFGIGSASAATDYKIVTASERGTYIQIGRDLARFVAPAADINLEVLPSAGSAENVRRLRYEAGVKFALVQSDVYQAFLDQAAGGNRDARALIAPLRVILPLYNEEIYFVARADSPLNFVHEIRDARISVGPIGSGTALSATTLYRQMFGQPLPESKSAFLSNEEGLAKLVTDKSVDVVVIVAGQPAKLFQDMQPESRKLIKMLRFDPSQRASQAALKTYFNATVRASSYPNLLSEDLPSVAVKSFLVTYDYNTQGTVASFQRFARSLCENFGRLQSDGHPKWKEVALDMPDVGRGWLYYGPTSRELKACIGGQSRAPAPKICSQQEQVLGLCR